MEIFKEQIKLKNEEDVYNVKVVLEDDVVVKDVLPDVKNILDYQDEIQNVNLHLEDGKLIISGDVLVNAIYVSDDLESSLQTINETLPFEERISVQENVTLDDIWYNIKTTYLKVTLINSRKINLRAVLGIDVFINNNDEIEVISDIEETNIEKKKNKMITQEISDILKGEIYLRDKYNIAANKPEIVNLLKANVDVNDVEIVTKGNELLLIGNATVKLLYLSNEEGEIVYDKFNIQFRENIDSSINNDFLNESNYTIQTMLFGKNVYIGEDENGENREVNIDFKLEYVIVVKNNVIKELLEDAFVVDKNLKIQSKENRSKALISKNVNNVNIKENIKLGNKDVIQVFDSKAEVNINSNETHGDAVEIKGVVDVLVYGVALDDFKPIITSKESFPFTQLVQVKNLNESNLITASAKVDNTSVNMASSDEVEVKVSFTLYVDTYFEKSNFIVEDVSIEELENLEEDESKVKIYISNKKEKVYDLAKRHNVKVKEMTLVNKEGIIYNLNSDMNIEKNDKIVVF